MANPVLERLRVTLESSRAAGTSFDDAWRMALRAVPAGDGWRAAVQATCDGWRDAYEHRPTARRVRAVAAIAFALDREQLNEIERSCARCGEEIPLERQNGARYCSLTCQRAAHRRRAA